MNNLSWLIIAADIIPSLSDALSVAAFLGFIVFGFFYLLGATGFFGSESSDSRYDEWAQDLAPRFRKAGPLLPPFAVLWLLSFAIPDEKETYYAVAASELGEEVVTSPTASKALKALDAWLENQLPDSDKTPNPNSGK